MPIRLITFKEQLNCQKMKNLKPLARGKGITPGKLRKAELVDALYTKMTNDRAKSNRKRRK